MKKISIILICCLCVALLFTACKKKTEEPIVEEPTVTQENGVGTATDSGAQATAVNEAGYVTLCGEIKEISEDNIVRVVGEGYEYNDIACKIDAETPIVNCKGEKTSMSDLKVGDNICVYVSSTMTRSNPPQATALCIITDLPDDGMGVPTYFEAGEVKATDSGTEVTSSKGDMIVTITKDLGIESYHDETATIDNIKVGSKMLAWYDVAMMSYPGQATATRVMLLD